MTSQSTVRVELYLRSNGQVPDRQTAVLESLRKLERSGTIDGVTVRTWPGAVDPSIATDPGGTGAVESFEEFRAWAESQGVSVSPPFEHRTHTSRITGERSDLVRTPVVCLALYEGDRLCGVYPHRKDDRVVTVTEAIEALGTAADVDEPADVPPPLPDGGSTDAPIRRRGRPVGEGRVG